jgi:xanthine/CO dehydrogenase XdhC/CoxF family maturation factor
MLIASDGRTWGTISGGCLERDLARRARLLAQESHHPFLICYETDGEDATEEEARPSLDPGPSLGCGGRIEILVQRVNSENPGPMAALTAVVRQRTSAAVANVIRTGSTEERHRLTGAGITKIGDHPPIGDIPDPILHAAMQRVIAVESAHHPFQTDRHTLSAGGWAEVWTEWLSPSQSLVIFGDGHDVQPLVEMAHLLGWHVTVIGTRPAAALGREFPQADQVICNPEPSAHDVPAGSAALVMGHNFRRDARILAELAHQPINYIGILGPRKRTARLLAAAGVSVDEENIFSPVGLDLGAENAEQIALSIVAEIQAIAAGRSGKSLRTQPGPIHLHQGESPQPCARR